MKYYFTSSADAFWVFVLIAGLILIPTGMLAWSRKVNAQVKEGSVVFVGGARVTQVTLQGKQYVMAQSDDGVSIIPAVDSTPEKETK